MTVLLRNHVVIKMSVDDCTDSEELIDKKRIKFDNNCLKSSDAFSWYKVTLKNPKNICAPMVNQSELAWRLFVRKHNVDLCYTPMFHAKNFITQPKYAAREFQTNPEDRPLIVQFCTDNPEYFYQAAKKVENCCDAVDLNLGCPQNIAKQGHYGSYLQDEWKLIHDIIHRSSHSDLKIPITCKIRIFEDVEKTLQYVKMLIDAGCKMITIHGRLREQKGQNTGLANWKIIKEIKKFSTVPVIANGNILNKHDVDRCFEETKCDGVMSAETMLTNPFLFENKNPLIWEMAGEYLDICTRIPTDFSIIRAHMFKFLLHFFNQHPNLRESFSKLHHLDEYKSFLTNIKKICELDENFIDSLEEYKCRLGKDNQSIPYWFAQEYIRNTSK